MLMHFPTQYTRQSRCPALDLAASGRHPLTGCGESRDDALALISADIVRVACCLCTPPTDSHVDAKRAEDLR